MFFVVAVPMPVSAESKSKEQSTGGRRNCLLTLPTFIAKYCNESCGCYTCNFLCEEDHGTLGDKIKLRICKDKKKRGKMQNNMFKRAWGWGRGKGLETKKCFWDRG